MAPPAVSTTCWSHHIGMYWYSFQCLMLIRDYQGPEEASVSSTVRQWLARLGYPQAILSQCERIRKKTQRRLGHQTQAKEMQWWRWWQQWGKGWWQRRRWRGWWRWRWGRWPRWRGWQGRSVGFMACPVCCTWLIVVYTYMSVFALVLHVQYIYWTRDRWDLSHRLSPCSGPSLSALESQSMFTLFFKHLSLNFTDLSTDLHIIFPWVSATLSTDFTIQIHWSSRSLTDPTEVVLDNTSSYTFIAVQDADNLHNKNSKYRHKARVEQKRASHPLASPELATRRGHRRERLLSRVLSTSIHRELVLSGSPGMSARERKSREKEKK